MIHCVDHVVVAVRDLAVASAAYSRLLGLEPSWRGVHGDFGTANTLFRFANTYLELLAPAGEGLVADTLRAYLDERGEGPLALAFGTTDASAAAATLRARGMPAPDPDTESGHEMSSGKERKWLRFSLPLARTRGVPIVVMMAGGYGHDIEQTVDVHFNTVRGARDLWSIRRGAAREASR
jgi:catechol 2,3-dioxygenase-like lactoylglutathione lyase family enzyme